MNYVCVLEIRIDIAIEMAKDNGPCTVEFPLSKHSLTNIRSYRSKYFKSITCHGIHIFDRKFRSSIKSS